jgi:hypothetical protein
MNSHPAAKPCTHLLQKPHAVLSFINSCPPSQAHSIYGCRGNIGAQLGSFGLVLRERCGEPALVRQFEAGWAQIIDGMVMEHGLH